jgi:hypothetical protein
MRIAVRSDSRRRSERGLHEQLQYYIPYRWFLDVDLLQE